MMSDEEFERRRIRDSYLGSCWKCNKDLDVYINEDGNDGSTAIYCLDCYDKVAQGK